LYARVGYSSVFLLAVIYPDGAPQDFPILAALNIVQRQFFCHVRASERTRIS
jgi:hypothetical protein